MEYAILPFTIKENAVEDFNASSNCEMNSKNACKTIKFINEKYHIVMIHQPHVRDLY